jgi:hypothetical protein
MTGSASDFERFAAGWQERAETPRPDDTPEHTSAENAAPESTPSPVTPPAEAPDATPAHEPVRDGQRPGESEASYAIRRMAAYTASEATITAQPATPAKGDTAEAPDHSDCVGFGVFAAIRDERDWARVALADANTESQTLARALAAANGAVFEARRESELLSRAVTEARNTIGELLSENANLRGVLADYDRTRIAVAGTAPAATTREPIELPTDAYRLSRGVMYAGPCAGCHTHLAQRADAWYSRSTRALYCLDCAG